MLLDSHATAHKHLSVRYRQPRMDGVACGGPPRLFFWSEKCRYSRDVGRPTYLLRVPLFHQTVGALGSVFGPTVEPHQAAGTSYT